VLCRRRSLPHPLVRGTAVRHLVRIGADYFVWVVASHCTFFVPWRRILSAELLALEAIRLAFFFFDGMATLYILIAMIFSRLTSIRTARFVDVQGLLETLVGLVMRVQNILQLFLLHVMRSSGAVVTSRRLCILVCSMDGLQYPDCLVLWRS